ncbi:MAG TPA: enoyl-CoA hydratase/isomerase family protein, partial [Albitalea sp.]|nr:enoyl-CoA hydratase/isomerase family protein [Albitalea sp.]
MTDELLYAVKDGIAVLTINRPQRRNALTRAVRDGIGEAFRRFEADPQAQVAILTGTGDTFCAGMDLHEAADTELRIPPAGFMPVLGDNIEVTKPVIAAVQGACIGAGLELIGACDIRLAAADATFSLRETRMGIVADLGALQRLPKIVGAGHAAELIYTGKDVDAARAREIG